MISESLEGLGVQSCRGHEGQRTSPFALAASGSGFSCHGSFLPSVAQNFYDELRKVGRAVGRNSTTIWKAEVNFLPGCGGEEGKVASGSHLLQADQEEVRHPSAFDPALVTRPGLQAFWLGPPSS